jgi:signal transduction histidine kinase/iron only hydrogenase large subunit-like protein
MEDGFGVEREMTALRKPLVTTLPERCRVCYTCVRECPAKAIRVSATQAQVIAERCIACGNCVRVCSQKAKQAASSLAEVRALLATGRPVAAMVAPSFPAEFAVTDYRRVVGALRALGFSFVHEVGFGADLVARRYRELLESGGGPYISTACPAIVSYVEKYYPNLVPYLAPVASPMVAEARVIKSIHGEDVGVVFLGPCVAKKGEAWREGSGVDEVLTFLELRQILAERGVSCDSSIPSEFDPPFAGSGNLFPLSRGMLQAAGIAEDLATGDVVAADGRTNFPEVIKEFQSEDLNARLLELLCCNGCVMGAGMGTSAPFFKRRAWVSRYTRLRMATLDAGVHQGDLARFTDIELGWDFHSDDQRIALPSDEELRTIMARMGKTRPEDELNCGACGYDTCIEHAIAIYRGLAENEMCLPHTIDHLKAAVKELGETNLQLESTQQALMHSERLASMGQLAAGIAHEVNNPLGVVLLYAHILLDETPADAPGREDLERIVREADRCKKIVSGLLNFARQNKVLLQSVNLEDLVEHAIGTVPKPDGVEVMARHSAPDLMADLDRDQMVQVLANLVRNAYEAMPQGGGLRVRTGAENGHVFISISDTGTGIPKEHLNKIYTPFFTTKPIGVGTGLGLPVTYGIVKMHRGDIQVQTNADLAAGATGTTFTVTLPRYGAREADARTGAGPGGEGTGS